MYAELIRMNNDDNGTMNFEQLTRNTGNQSEEKQGGQQNRYNNDFSDYGKKQLSTVEEENASQCSDMTLTQGKFLGTHNTSASKRSIRGDHRESIQKVQSIHQHTIPRSFSITEEPDENELADRVEQIVVGSDVKDRESTNTIKIKIEEPNNFGSKSSIQMLVPGPSGATTMACSKQASTSQLHSSQYTSGMTSGMQPNSNSNSAQNSIANYATGIKIENILHNIQNGSNGSNYNMQTSSGSLDIDAEENFSIAHCEEHRSRRRLADGEAPILTGRDIIAGQPDEELEPYQASKKGTIPNGSRLFKNRRGI